MAQLTFFVERLLLADDLLRNVVDCIKNPQIAVALQFLDYPLLLLKASQTNTFELCEQLVIRGGKTCVLNEQDEQEVLFLAKQVRQLPAPGSWL